MVIQSKDLPFSFEIIDGFNVTRNIKFYNSISDLNAKKYTPDIILKELRDIYVAVSSQFDIRLEMSGFDSYNTSPFMQDEDGTYLAERNHKVQIFSSRDFPLPPGNYDIKITVNGISYFTGFRIVALNLTQNLWNLMAFEVKESIKFMAMQFAKTHYILADNVANEMLMGDLFLKMKVLDQNFNKVIAALDDLCYNAHSKISKQYMAVRSIGVHREDAKSYMLNARKHKDAKEFAPVKYTDYQLNENIFIKLKVLELEALIKGFLREIEGRLESLQYNIDNDSYGKKYNSTEYIRKVNVCKQIAKYLDEANKINNTINRLKDSDWFKSINLHMLTKISSQSMFDPRYGIISELSKALKKNSIHFDMDASLTYIDQRSDKLYELWCFLKIIEVCQTLGFTLLSGMNVDEDEYGFYVNALDSGYGFALKKDRVLLKIYYEKTIPSDLNQTDKFNEPIFTISTHNLPDCRIDIYLDYDDSEMDYVGSIVVDFKYRKKYNFWDRIDDNRVKMQLKAYKEDTKTKFIGNNVNLSLRTIKPVIEVWALYPDVNFPTAVTDAMNSNVKLYSFVPGHEESIYDHLNEFFSLYLTDDYVKAEPQKQIAAV